MTSIEKIEGARVVKPGSGAGVIRVLPERIVGWGIDADALRCDSRSAGICEEGS